MLSNAWLLAYLLPVFSIIVGVSFIFMTVLLLPMGGAVGGAVVGLLVVGMIAVVLLIIIGFIVNLVLTYKLVKRRNTHFKRQQFLLEDIVAAAKTLAEKKRADAEVGLSSCERTVREFKAEETEKGAVLWAILSAVPYVGSLASWYIYYFLMKDFYKHEKREDGFWEDIGKLLDKCGVKFSAPRRSESIPDRSFVLYLILSIITVGIFGIYWLYVLLKDPNTHFKYHMQVEDQLLSTLESMKL